MPFAQLAALNLETMNKTWFLLPLAVAISLVYCASRHEAPAYILKRALRMLTSILVVMGVVLLVLFLLSYNL